jgi:hypothetical protein
MDNIISNIEYDKLMPKKNFKLKALPKKGELSALALISKYLKN